MFHSNASSIYNQGSADTEHLIMKMEPEDFTIEDETFPSVPLENLCRMCSNPRDNMRGPTPQLTYQLDYFFGINILADDGLPKRVCSLCCKELSHWEQVRSSVEQAQTCLRQIRDNQTPFLVHQQDNNIQESDSEMFDGNSLGLPGSNDKEYTLKKQCTVVPNVSTPVKHTVLPNENILAGNVTLPNSAKFVDIKTLVSNATKIVKSPLVSKNVNPLKHTVLLLPNSSGKFVRKGVQPKAPITGLEILSNAYSPVEHTVLSSTNSFVGHTVFSNTSNTVRLTGLQNANKPVGHTIFSNTSNTARLTGLQNANKPVGHTVLSNSSNSLLGSVLPSTSNTVRLTGLQNANKTLGLTVLSDSSNSLLDSVLPSTSNTVQHTKMQSTNKHTGRAVFVRTNPKPVSVISKPIAVSDNNSLKPLPFAKADIIHEHSYCENSNTEHESIGNNLSKLRANPPQHKTRNKIAKESSKRKIRPHSPNNPYQCGHCPIKFQKLSALKQHLQAHLSANIKLKKVQCPHCEVKFYGIESLLKHQTKHIKYPGKVLLFTCDKCEIRLPSLKKLENHMKIHLAVSHYCHTCMKWFESKELLKVHAKSHKQSVATEKMPCLPDIFSKSKFDKDGKLIPVQIAPKFDPLNPWICNPIENQITEPVVKKRRVKNVSSTSKITQVLYLPPVQLNQNSENSLNQIVLTEDILKQLFNTAESSENKEICIEPIKVTKETSKNSKTIIDDSLDYPCGICNLNFKGASLFMSHLATERTNINMKTLPCGFCRISIRSLHDLVTHTRDHILHPEKTIIFQCDICSKKFLKESYCQHHMESHNNHLKYKCTFCQQCFSHTASLTTHIRRKHYLDYALNSYQSVSQITDDTTDLNLSVHTKGKIKFQAFLKESEHYSCDICNYKYFSSNLLFKHYLEKHVIENDYNCMICSKCTVFNDKLEFYKHLKSHSVVLKYFCPICDRPFTRSRAMEIHKLLHSLDRPFTCQFCNKTYRSKSILHTHIKFTHKNVPKLMCEYCSIECLSKPLLKRHILVRHRPEDLPFVCDVCGVGFISELKLKSHKFKHTSERPLHCTKCYKGFYNVRNWRRHMIYICNIPEEDITYFSKKYMFERRDL